MVESYKPYLAIIRDTLMYTLCLRNFPSQKYEKINRPQVEVEENSELCNKPIVITRSEEEKVLIESSINSVRISVLIKKHGDLEKLLVGIYTKFLMNRANRLNIFRKVPKEGYDISFLITNSSDIVSKAKLFFSLSFKKLSFLAHSLNILVIALLSPVS